MKPLNDLELNVMELRQPELKPVIQRYRYCVALYPEVCMELDEVCRRLGFYRDSTDHPDIIWARENVNLVEDELQRSEQILCEAIQSAQVQTELQQQQ